MANLKRVKRGKNQLPLNMSSMVRLIKPNASCEDLCFSRSTMVELRRVCSSFNSFKNQIIVTAGGSSAEKKLAVEVIAAQLRMDLVRIDLSVVVSKYIGETEKNLNHVFDSVRNDDCILFFDEADALFGKRSEVKDSGDRYANVEISYLLQRLESHPGLIIVAVDDTRFIDFEFQHVSRVIDLSNTSSE